MAAAVEAELRALKTALVRHGHKKGLAIVEEAFYFAKNAHKGQLRASGGPYLAHLTAVAQMVAEKGLDETIVSAALLHDVIEDTGTKPAEIRAVFGDKIASLVDGLTKLDIVSFKSRKEHTAANVIKTMVASAKDLRVLLLKLFDKLHNLRTLRYLDRQRQKRIAADTLLIYVPISHKLGMHSLKYELEDICFSFLEPAKYKKLKKEVSIARRKKSIELLRAMHELRKHFPHMRWRFVNEEKSIYSIHSKIINRNITLDQINDARILTIIVGRDNECYDALGKLHSVFKPIPKKLKDYIALPENSIYQSLHTEVIGPAKKPIKCYICSEKMFEVGNEGVVALLCKDGNGNNLKRFEKIFSKIGKPASHDSKELAGDLRFDFHSRTLITFTETGEVIELPPDSTAIDFAYFKDCKKAGKASNAEINGRILPLWTKLEVGDRVKIIYSNAPQLQISWLSLASSEKVRRDIEKSLHRRLKPKGGTGFVKFRIESVDKPGQLMEQCRIMAKNGFSLETCISKVNRDKTTSYTEFIVRNTKNSNLEKAVRKLRDLKETIGFHVDYLK